MQTVESHEWIDMCSSFFELHYTVSQKNDTKLLPITSPDVNQFSEFFHSQTQW